VGGALVRALIIEMKIEREVSEFSGKIRKLKKI
jgi:hypothetical protein